MDVIKAATASAAEILGQADLGTIAVGKTGDFVAMPENPLEKMSNIKDVGLLFIDGSEQERSALIQNIQINTSSFVITKEQRAADAVAEAQAAKEAAEKGLPHYGEFVLGPSVFVRSMSLPVPKGGKAESKPGPPDRITVSMVLIAPRAEAHTCGLRERSAVY